MAKKDLPALSAAESEILGLVWRQEKATVQMICDNLPTIRKITYATVQTLLRRLEKKGYIAHETKGKAHLFYAAVDPSEVKSRCIDDVVQKLFAGDPMSLMVHFAEHGKIEAAGVERLKKLIKKKKSR